MIELMVAIAIAGIISSAIGAFMIFHISSYESTKKIIDIQYESQVGLESFGKIAMESKGIYKLEDSSGVDKLATSLEIVNPRFIVFKSEDLDAVTTIEIPIYYAYFIDYTKDEIYFQQCSDEVEIISFYNSTKNNTNLFMQYVDSITISQIGKDINGLVPSYADTNAIQLQLNMKNHDAEFTISNQYEFRNKVD